MWELCYLGSGVNHKRWADRTIELHYQRMAKIRPNLDSTLTTMQEVQNRSIQHYSKSKKDQLLQDRFTQIERENRILLEKMATIMQKPENAAGFVRFPSTGIKRTLNGPFRKKELRRIAIENKGILERLQSKRSQYSTYDMEIKYLQNKKRVRNLCEFPHILGRTSHRSAGRSIMRRPYKQTDSTTPYLGPAGPVTAIGDDPLDLHSPPRIQSQRAASGIASHPTPIVKGGLPLPPQANTMAHGFDLNVALSPFDDLGGNLPPLNRKKQIRKLKPLDYRVIQLDPNRAVLYKHSFLLEDRWITIEISRTSKKFFIVGYDVDQRKAHLIDLTDKQCKISRVLARKLLGECDNSIDQVVGRLGFTPGGKFIIHDWNKLEYPSLVRQGSVSAGAGSMSSRKKRRDQSPYIRHSNESVQPRDQSAPPARPRPPSDPYSQEFDRGEMTNDAPIESFLPAMPSPPPRPPSLPKQEAPIELPALKSPTSPTPPIQEEPRPDSQEQEKQEEAKQEQNSEQNEAEEKDDNNYEEDYEEFTERQPRQTEPQDQPDNQSERQDNPKDSFLGRPSFEEDTQIQLNSPGEVTEPPITITKEQSKNSPFQDGASSIKPNASMSSEGSGDLTGAVVQHISAITPAPQDDYVSMTDVEGRPSSSPDAPSNTQGKKSKKVSGIQVKHANEDQSSNQAEPSKEQSQIQSQQQTPVHIDSAGNKSLEMPQGTPPEYGELSHEELAQIRNFDPDVSPEEGKKEQEDFLAQSYADRELPSDLRKESKPSSALPQEEQSELIVRKTQKGTAILVEQEDKESMEGGIEERATPPGLSMRDSNDSGVVKQDIEDKIPSTGHLESQGNNLIESTGAHQDLDAIPEQEPGDMTPTPLPKKEPTLQYLKKEEENKFEEPENERLVDTAQLPAFGGDTGAYQQEAEEQRYPEDEESAGTPEPLVEESEDGGIESEEQNIQEGTGGPEDKKEADI